MWSVDLVNEVYTTFLFGCGVIMFALLVGGSSD